MNRAHTHDARAGAVVQNVERRFTRFALAVVREFVEDAGGEWSKALSDKASEAAAEYLRSEVCAPILRYHAWAESASDLWHGEADHALNGAARRAASRIGMPMMNRAACAALDAVCAFPGEDSGVTINMRARDGREPGGGAYQRV